MLAVYSVKTNTDQDNPQEVATMDDGKKQLLKDIFWEMNQISSRTESKTETAFCRRLDYISERYCAGLKTKSLKIQT